MEPVQAQAAQYNLFWSNHRTDSPEVYQPILCRACGPLSVDVVTKLDCTAY